jgi:hypothetical protein
VTAFYTRTGPTDRPHGPAPRTGPTDRQDLARLWREIITEGCGFAVVIEDRDAPVGKRFHYSAIGLVITDAFRETVKRGEAAYISRRVLDLWRAGNPPFLNAQQIQRANSTTGILMLVMHTGLLPEHLDPEAGRYMRDHVETYCYHGLGGFNFRELLYEAYGDFQRQWLTGLGMPLRTDNSGYFAAHGLESPPQDQHPYLVGVTSAEIATQHGALIRLGFVRGKPRFFFKPAERKMLQFAIEGLTDEEVAKYLSVSVASIRKHWESVYARVGEVAPELLEPASGRASPGGQGAQKKRRLIGYLRHHMEEMRPYESQLPWK